VQPTLASGGCLDVLVVGAGPAGSSAARSAAMAGASVLMIDKRRSIGEPAQCAGYVPRLLVCNTNALWIAVVQEIETLSTHMPDGEVLESRAPGYVVDRAKFDQVLAAQAASVGVRILTSTRALSKQHDRVKLRGPYGELDVRCSVVVGADGSTSTVGSWIGRRNRKLMVGLQHTVRVGGSSRAAEAWFDRGYRYGYAWLFPRGELAHVGVAVQSPTRGATREALECFKTRLGKRIGEVVGRTAGLVPVGGPVKPSDDATRIILVGDAAGQTHPITGAGILQAVICGGAAGQQAAAAARGCDSAFADYEARCRNEFGAMLTRATSRREKMETEWDGGDLSALLRLCWVGSRDYHLDADRTLHPHSSIDHRHQSLGQ
jgi:digeranylgeranylglycerophospholipid reductase